MSMKDKPMPSDTDFVKVVAFKTDVPNANGVVYPKEVVTKAMEKHMQDRQEVKAGNPIVNRALEGGYTRDQVQMDFAFNSKYGSMGSGNVLYRELTKSLFANLEQCDNDSWMITGVACKATVKEIFDIELENGYDKIPKAVVIGAMRPYVWLDDRTNAIPEDGYSIMEFVEFLKGMLDIDQLREMDPVERKAMLNHRCGSYGAFSEIEAKYLYPNTLTSECRVQGKKILAGPDWMKQYKELYPEENIKGAEAKRVSIVAHDPVGTVPHVPVGDRPINRVAIIGGGVPIGAIGRAAIGNHLSERNSALHGAMQKRILNHTGMILSDIHISYPFADVAEVEEDRPQTVKGNGRQLIIDNGNGKSWPAARTRKGHRRG